MRAAAIAVAMAILCCAAGVSDAALQRDARVRPPAAVKCPRATNDLTVYIGLVVYYDRQPHQTTIRIRTDWATTEEVTIDHKGGSPANWFLSKGDPFTAADWSQITDSTGRLRPSTRAAAWVCDDGSNPIVDWHVKSDTPAPAPPLGLPGPA